MEREKDYDLSPIKRYVVYSCSGKRKALEKLFLATIS